MADKQFEITFQPSGRGKAQCPPNPGFLNGTDIDMVGGSGAPSCTANLPYPAPECGLWVIRCKRCPMSLAVTAAGRVDDPRSIKMTCKAKIAGN